MSISRPIIFHLSLALCAWLVWYGAAGEAAFQAVDENWPISLTMVFGSFIAGATSEGGGAVAFPVFTKLLHIQPSDAKVFSLAIQSVGMTAASLLIVVMRIQVEWWVIRWASLSGVLGMLVGAIWLAPLFTAAEIKLTFTLLVSSFAVTLFALNRGVRDVHLQVPGRGTEELRLVLLAGFVGGCLSGMVGNGIDIVVFSLMVLLFRVCEKVSTPTSVILMAINSIVGFYLHAVHLDAFTAQVQAWWLAAVPVVVVGAPLGAMLCARMSRTSIARVLMFLIAIEFVSSLILIPIDTGLALASSLTLLVFAAVYMLMYRSKRYEPLVEDQGSST